VVQICRALLEGQPYTGKDVGDVGLSAIGPCMLALDAQGRPLRPGILYGVDARAEAEIEYLTRELGEETVYDFSGMVFTSQGVGPKILWMRNHEPEMWDRVDHITTASSYLIYRLTGEKVIDRHTASHYMPLMDIRTL
jgi:xylulokinase